jgi:hypothetical protein
VERDWFAESVPDAQLAVCIRMTTVGGKECGPYTDGSMLTLKYQTVYVRLVALKTGEQIDTHDFNGPQADTCPETRYSTNDYVGSLPNAADVLAWIKQKIGQ